MKIRSHALLIILICLILFIQPSSILGQMEDTSTTRADGNQPPQVIDVSPAKGSSSRVSIDEDIIVSFNEFMDKGQTEDAFTLSSNKDGDITGKFNWVGYTLIFDPNNELDHGTTFTVTISTNARNLTGVNFTQEFKWNFTTVEGESGSGKSDDKSGKEDWWRFWEPILTGGTIFGTFLVALIGFLLYRRKRTELRRYIGRLDDVYEKYRRDPYVCEHKLSQLKESCKIKFKRGKMEENHYLIMDKKIDDYLRDIRYRKTLTKPKIVAGVEKEIHDELDKNIVGKGKSGRRRDIEDEYDDDEDRQRIKIDESDDDEPVDIDDYDDRPKKPSKPRIINDS